MLKLVGSILLVTTGAGLGCLKADKLVKQHKNVKKTVQMLNDIYIMLESSCLTKSEILSRLENSDNYRELVQPFSVGGGCVSKSGYLEEEDMYRLSCFFEQLGSTDLNGQLSRTRLCINEFIVREKVCAERTKRYAKLYRGMGVLIGAMIAVMLM